MEYAEKAIHKTLGTMAKECAAVLVAAGAGNDMETRLGIDRLRGLRAELFKINGHWAVNEGQLSEYNRQEMSDDLRKIKSTEAFIDQWNNRYLGILTEEQLYYAEPDAYLDSKLPNNWHWKRDVIVLLGESADRLESALIKRGQLRIIKSETCPGSSELANESCSQYFGKFVSHPPYRIIILTNEFKEGKMIEFPETRSKFEKEGMQCWANRNTVHNFGKRWIEQGLRNVVSLIEAPSVMSLKEVLSGVPMVIVSPGPSLEGNIRVLRKLKGRALIVAVAQSVPALKAVGVDPDIIVVADPINHNYVLDGYDVSKPAALFSGVSCHPDLWAMDFRNKLSFNANSAVDNWLAGVFGDQTFFNSGGSVSVQGLVLGLELRCDPIVLVGQDLSYVDDRLYAGYGLDATGRITIDPETGEGILSGLPEAADRRMKMLEVPGYYGGTVKTDQAYYLYHKQFQEKAFSEKNSIAPVRLYNCTEGGASIEGFEQIRLEQFASQLEATGKHYDFAAIIESALSRVDYIARVRAATLAVTDMKERLIKIVDYSLHCSAILEKYEQGWDKEDALIVAEHNLMKALAEDHMISMVLQPKLEEAVFVSQYYVDDAHAYSESLKLYRTIGATVESLLQIVVPVLGEIMASDVYVKSLQEGSHEPFA